MQCQVACKRLISKSRQELRTVMKEVQLLKQFHHVCEIEDAILDPLRESSPT